MRITDVQLRFDLLPLMHKSVGKHRHDPDDRGVITSNLNKVINWGRKYSFFPFPFVTACCGMEFMATWGSHYDVARFGAEFPRFSPRQSDLLMVVGTVNHKIAPVLKVQPGRQRLVRPGGPAGLPGPVRQRVAAGRRRGRGGRRHPGRERCDHDP